MIKEIIEKAQYILNYYGEEHQAYKAIEELNELAVAISHAEPGEMLEEMADVYIMLLQLMNFEFFDYYTFEKMLINKVNRQLARIDAIETNKVTVNLRTKN